MYETERLIIRPFSVEEDAGFLLELYNMPDFIKYIGDRKIRTLDDARNYIETKFLPQISRLGFGNCVVLLKENSEKIGGVGIFEREGLDVADIGFSVLKKYEGKGFMYEASQKLMSVAREEFGLNKISAITTTDNFSSQKLIEKLGLKFQKVVTIPGDEAELMYYETE